MTGKGFQCRAIGEDDSGKNPREEGDCLHLGVMAHLDDLHIIRTECHCNCSCHGNDLACSQGKHQQEGSEKGNEQIARRPAAYHQELIYLLGPVAIEIINESRSRHAAEHRICPCSRVSRI